MRQARSIAAVLATFAAGLGWSCASSQQLRTPEQPGQILVVLLPDGTEDFWSDDYSSLIELA